MPLDLLDLQGNEGLVAAAAAPVPEQLLTQVQQAMQRRLGDDGDGGRGELVLFWGWDVWGNFQLVDILYYVHMSYICV